MLHINFSTSAAAAASYFDKGLEADYYAQDKEPTIWKGKGAELLGIAGKQMDRETFVALASGLAPDGKTQLTARIKEDRRSGYDFTFDAPKSVSLAQVFGTEQNRSRVQSAFDHAVQETMNEIEAEMHTRVRKGGAFEDRVTGNVVYAIFSHDQTRPVSGSPDPHLHSHVYIMNVTFDPKERIWKAGEFSRFRSEKLYWQERFHSRLAEGLQKLGFGIRRHATGWEIAGLSQKTIDKFSKRKCQVEDAAKKLEKELAADAQIKMRAAGARGIILSFEDALAEAKSELGGKTRSEKTKSDPVKTKASWDAQLTPQEKLIFANLKDYADENILDKERVGLIATQHIFEKASVARQRELEAEVLKLGIGGAVKVGQETQVFQKMELLAGTLRPEDPDHPRRSSSARANQEVAYYTIQEVLDEEKRIISLVKEGFGKHDPILGEGQTWEIKNNNLNEGQRKALFHLLHSRDFITAIRGPFGTGKTTMMQEAIDAIQTLTGKTVYTFAPSAQAVQNLREEGFTNSHTIAELLVNKQLQEQIQGQFVWKDESGLVGTKTMREALDLIHKSGARDIWSGDRHQHRAVERGDILALAEDHAGLKSVQLTDILRQRSNPALLAAVEELAKGTAAGTSKGFDKLLAIPEAIREIGDQDTRRLAILKQLEKNLASGTSLLITPTHPEIALVTKWIRDRSKETGRLDQEKERIVVALAPADLSEGQRRDSVNYEPGMIVDYHSNAKGSKKGQQFEVIRTGDSKVWVKPCSPGGAVTGAERELNLNTAPAFQVFEKKELELCPGDQVRITKNQTQIRQDGVKISLKNGDIEVVREILPGRIIFDSGAEMALTNRVNSSKETPGMRRANLEPKVSTRRDHPASHSRFHPRSGKALQPSKWAMGKRIGTEDQRNPHPEYRSESAPQYNSHFGYSFTHGYVVTSYSSQSRTLDRTILDMPISTFGAASRQQWGVAISRAKHEVTVFTDAVDQLREAILRSEARPSAHDIGAQKEPEREKAKRSPEQAPSPERYRPPAQPDPSYDTYHSYTENQPEPSQDRGQERSID
jgi:conjugative relaxase-like TrwC/TraI family protein